MRQKEPKHYALILVEGETEVEFFDAISELYFKGIPKTQKNLKGNFNIHNKVIDRIVQFADEHKNDTFDVYICIDQEVPNVPAFDKSHVEERVKSVQQCCEVVPVIANLMTESLFFIDINGNYKFLRTKKTLRKPERYKQFRQLKHQDLSRLFKESGKVFVKGRRCESLVHNLDIKLIVETAVELTSFVEKVQKLGK